MYDKAQNNNDDLLTKRSIYISKQESSFETELNFQTEDYCEKTMTNMLDQVELYHEKKDMLTKACFNELKTNYREATNWKEQSKNKALEFLKLYPDESEERKIELVEQMLLEQDTLINKDIEDELGYYEKHIEARIPIFAVPQASFYENEQYDYSIKTNLINEGSLKSGLFGWCFCCRESADLYCKQHRIPVCSIECKINHIKMLKYIDHLKEEVESTVTTKGPQAILKDLSLVTRYLCR